MFTWQLPLNSVSDRYFQVPGEGKDCQELESRKIKLWSKEQGEEQAWRAGARCGLALGVRGIYLG